jgi:hypothetical protein
MKIQIKVKANSKKEGVERLADGTYRVSVKAPAREGKANEALLSLLAKYFCVPKSTMKLVRGKHAKMKTVEF